MPVIGPDLLEPRAVGVSCIYPLLLKDGFRQSFAYNRLPQQLLTLSVLKLDGSSFDVQVPMAVQDTFSQAYSVCWLSYTKHEKTVWKPPSGDTPNLTEACRERYGGKLKGKDSI